jgi:acyl-CoA reductase-like NAD-dependent aldehyde dehydrogenase
MNAALRNATASVGATVCGQHCSFGTAGVSESDVQQSWASLSVGARLKVLRGARHRMAEMAGEFAEAVSPALARTKADTLVTELLPLLDACRFLEGNAERLLRPRKLGRAGRAMWLGSVWAEVHREPLGHVLVIGPANFPLFLAGVQVLQALAAGNAVTWKPGTGGRAVAELVARALREAGLAEGLLRVTKDSVEVGRTAIAAGADKVVFTGSSSAGEAVLTELAKTATPAVVELSGADAVVVLPSADLNVVAKAVAFGLRLNGGAVCMSPRRLFAKAATLEALKPLLMREFEDVPAVRLNERTGVRLTAMVEDAVRGGARVIGSLRVEEQRPLVMEEATAEMEIARSDVFAPVISLIAIPSLLHLHEAYAKCDYALTVSIFCGKNDLAKAREIARTLKAGTVLINDLIAPTADARVPFGGRGASGYGVTRGAEGLLEMTAVKTLIVRKGGPMRHLEATTDADAPVFEGMIRASHGDGWRMRWSGLRQFVAAQRKRNG